MEHFKWLHGYKTEQGMMFYCVNHTDMFDLDCPVFGFLTGDKMLSAMKTFNKHWVKEHMNIDKNFQAHIDIDPKLFIFEKDQT